jgi:hypothetical protein
VALGGTAVKFTPEPNGENRGIDDSRMTIDELVQASEKSSIVNPQSSIIGL